MATTKIINGKRYTRGAIGFTTKAEAQRWAKKNRKAKDANIQVAKFPAGELFPSKPNYRYGVWYREA